MQLAFFKKWPRPVSRLSISETFSSKLNIFVLFRLELLVHAGIQKHGNTSVFINDIKFPKDSTSKKVWANVLSVAKIFTLIQILP